MPDFQDLTGKKFGKWTVIERVPNHISPTTGKPYTQYKCQCECGTIRNVLASSLTNGRSKSCGCLGRIVSQNYCKDHFTTHGKSKTRLYKIWAGMIKRCENENASNYHLYGGRGINVCDEWHDYKTFDRWATQNGYKDNLSIDRVDVNGDYCPENCRWADKYTQANNRRGNVYYEYNGEKHTLIEWSRLLGKSYSKLYKRVHNKKMTLKEALANY